MGLAGAASDEYHSTSRVALGREHRVHSLIQIRRLRWLSKVAPLVDPLAAYRVEQVP